MVCLAVDGQNLTKSPIVIIQQMGSVEECADSMICACVDYQTHLNFDQQGPNFASELIVTCTTRQCLYGAEIVCENVKVAEIYTKSGYLKSVSAEALIAEGESDDLSSISSLYFNFLMYQPLLYVKCRLIRLSNEIPINVFHIHLFTSATISERRNSRMLSDSPLPNHSMNSLQPSLPLSNITSSMPLPFHSSNVNTANSLSSFTHLASLLPFQSSAFGAPRSPFPILPSAPKQQMNGVSSAYHASSKFETVSRQTQTVDSSNISFKDEMSEIERRLAAKIDRNYSATMQMIENMDAKMENLSQKLDAVVNHTERLISNGYHNSESTLQNAQVEEKADEYASQLSQSIIESALETIKIDLD